MTLNFHIHGIGFLGEEDISSLPFQQKEQRIENEKKAAVELLDNAHKNLAGCQIASDCPKNYEVVIRVDYARTVPRVEVIVPHLIVANYPSDFIEMARAVVWLNMTQTPLKVSHVTSNNMDGLTAKIDGDKLTVLTRGGDVMCTAMLGPYLQNVRTLLATK